MTKRIRVARTVQITSMNPLLYNDKGTGEYLQRHYSHLVVTDAHSRYRTGSIVHAMRRGPRHDGRSSYLFQLRPAMWHDGTPVTARDVQFTIEAVLDEDFPTPRRPELLAVGSDLTAIPRSDREILIEFGGHGVGLRGLAWLPILPRHYYGTAANLRSHDLPPVGSGEFCYQSGQAGGLRAAMTANSAHWTPAGVDLVEWRRFDTSRDAVDSVLAGESEIATRIQPSLADRAADAPGVAVHVSNDGTVAYLAYNLDAPLVGDRDLRAALTDAIDRVALVDQILHGHGRTANSLIHPDTPWHCPDLSPPTTDLRAATAALDRLGWRRSADGFRRDRSGRPFAVTLHTVAEDEVKRAAAGQIVEQLGRVGVRVEVRPVSIAELLNQHIYPRRYDLALLALNPGPTPSYLRAFYHSGGNRFGYRNAAVDELIDTLPVDWDEADPTAVAAVHDIQRRVDRDVPHTPLFFPKVIDVASTRLTLPPVDGLFISRFSDLHNWRITEPAHGGNGDRGYQ